MAYINLETRQIALIGIGTVCKHFYMQFQGMLDIKYCFSVGANKKSSNMECFFAGSGVKYEPFEASLVRKQNLLLVMCAGHEFRKRNDKILYNKGFQWGKDYIDSLYVVQYYRKKYDLRLENKNIWIFGAGNTGKRFYDKYREVYKIGGFISNFSTETACLGLPVIRPGEITRQDAPHVVICCNEEALIAEQLGKMGYRGGQGFYF